MSALHSFWRLLREAPPGKMSALLALMVATGLTEGIGILLLVPLLEVLEAEDGAPGPGPGVAQAAEPSDQLRLGIISVRR